MEISTVLPEDTSKLTIYPDQDYVTLVTCTPYGVNTHRLLVRGARIPYDQAETIVQDAIVEDIPKSTWRQEYMKGLIYGLGGILAVAGTIAVIMFSRKHRSTTTNVPRRSDRYSMPSPHLSVTTTKRRMPAVPQRKRGKHEAP